MDADGFQLATVTVTATDPGGLSAEQSFVVTVPNRPPHTVGMIADRDLYVGDTIGFDAAEHFGDPDGDTLAYAATSSDSSFTAVRVTGSAASPAAADLPRKRRRFNDFMDSSRCRCRRTMMSKADPSDAVRRGPDPPCRPGRYLRSHEFLALVP